MADTCDLERIGNGMARCRRAGCGRIVAVSEGTDLTKYVASCPQPKPRERSSEHPDALWRRAATVVELNTVPTQTIGRLLAEIEADQAAGKLDAWEKLGRTRAEVEGLLLGHCPTCEHFSPAGCGDTDRPCHRWGLLRIRALVTGCRRWR